MATMPADHLLNARLYSGLLLSAIGTLRSGSLGCSPGAAFTADGRGAVPVPGFSLAPVSFGVVGSVFLAPSRAAASLGRAACWPLVVVDGLFSLKSDMGVALAPFVEAVLAVLGVSVFFLGCVFGDAAVFVEAALVVFFVTGVLSAAAAVNSG